MSSTWTYEGYWLTVLGTKNAAGVVAEYDLSDKPAAGAGSLDAWLGESEAAAWSAGRTGGPLPEEWSGFHALALDELTQACAGEA